MFRKIILGFLLLGVGCTSIPSPAFSQDNVCALGTEMRESLLDNYNESQRGWGITTNNYLFQMFSREDADRSWSALQTNPKNALQTCILAVGDNATAYSKDNGIQPDGQGRVLVWNGTGVSEVGDPYVFEVFVNKVDDTWLVKRTSSSGIRIMATGTDWTETPNENFLPVGCTSGGSCHGAYFLFSFAG